jgi:hypothetical protein
MRHHPTNKRTPMSDARGPSASSGPNDEAKRTLPREHTTAVPEPRTIETPDGEWIARLVGRSVGGTGSYNLALLEAIFFFRAHDPETPLREILVGRGSFERLSDAELAALLERARPMTSPGG